MSVQFARTTSMAGGNVRVKDVLIAKAIRSGYNPYCRSTDADARRVTDAMRQSTMQVRLPAARSEKVTAKKPPVREVKPSNTNRTGMPAPHHEVIALENFELVKRKPTRISFARLASVMACALILTAIVYGGSQINEESRRYSELNAGLELLQKENQALELELKEKNDLTVIEDMAKNDLGMIKVSAAEQRYLTLSGEDGIKTYAEKDKDTGFGMNLLNAFGEKITDLLAYLD